MSRHTLSLIAVILLGATPAQDVPRFASAREMRSQVAKTTDGVAGMTVPTGPDGLVLFARRTSTGEVEVHTVMNDEIIVRDGKATILVGGRVEGNRMISPSEWRGGTISGARRYDVVPGDSLWIPAGVPHQVQVPKGGSIAYFAAKFAAGGNLR